MSAQEERHEPSDHRAVTTRGHLVETCSRMNAWWWSLVRGWTVLHIVRTPRLGLFGRIKYDNTWILTTAPVRKK